MSKIEKNIPIAINASPTKRFFVEMLTRDIALEDAILDLLDNCVDGAMRERKKTKQNFSGCWAKIAFDQNSFVITDNCGGIPLDVATNYAFRMGKPKSASSEENLPTVGAYGIGMKRALFRLGCHAEVLWRLEGEGAHDYRVEFGERWLSEDDNWHLDIEPVVRNNHIQHPGTRVHVLKLHQPIAAILANPSFIAGLVRRIGELYSVIIGKGFQITCNGAIVKPKPLAILNTDSEKMDDARIEPYIYKDEINGVKVFLAIGLTQPLVKGSKAENPEFRQRESEEAGITVICNDRVVLYNDKTRLTGWGELGVPGYHTQFISIGGIVQFSCENALKLPLTTTKRGIDESSEVYGAIKGKIREGLKTFTQYTYAWKANLEQERIHHLHGITKLQGIAELSGKPLEVGIKTSKPTLPAPPPAKPTDSLKIIQYRRNKSKIAAASRFFFGHPNESAVKVGEASFDHCLELAMESEED